MESQKAAITLPKVHPARALASEYMGVGLTVAACGTKKANDITLRMIADTDQRCRKC